MFYLGSVSLIWAFSFGLIGNTLAGVDLFFAASVRLGCATLLFLPFLRFNRVSKFEAVRLVAYGAIQFGLMYVCYMNAFHYLPSHLVALFSILTPVYVVMIHDLRKRSFSKLYFAVAFLSVLGAACIRAKEIPKGEFWLGFALMQIAGLSFAFGQIAYRDWKLKHEKIADHTVFALLTFGGFVFAGIFSLFVCDFRSIELSSSQLKAILYLGFIASGLGFYLWNKGASRTNPGILAAFNNAVVPLAVFCSLFIFQEIKDFNSTNLFRLVAGSILVVSALFIGKKRIA